MIYTKCHGGILSVTTLKWMSGLHHFLIQLLITVTSNRGHGPMTSVPGKPFHVFGTYSCILSKTRTYSIKTNGCKNTLFMALTLSHPLLFLSLATDWICSNPFHCNPSCNCWVTAIPRAMLLAGRATRMLIWHVEKCLDKYESTWLWLKHLTLSGCGFWMQHEWESNRPIGVWGV